ncbi:MAG: VWA domain-containing protein [Deltaproteobacteria bacterium]|nr:VWA domain-containing protein [Deltaproteobacteria bacterium]
MMRAVRLVLPLSLLGLLGAGCTTGFGLRASGRLVATPVLPAGVMYANLPPPSGVVYAGAGGGAIATADVQVRISFFGVPLDGASDVVFVLDRSGSMATTSFGVAGRDVGMSQTGSVLGELAGTVINHAAGAPLPSKLTAAKQELARVLRLMPDGTRFNIVFFDDDIAALSGTMVTLDPYSREHALAFVAGIRTGGSTAAVPALRAAYGSGARRVVLLSDGLANTGGDGGDLLREARAQMQYGVRFDTVGVGLDQDDALLRTLAAQSGGMAVTR